MRGFLKFIIKFIIIIGIIFIALQIFLPDIFKSRNLEIDSTNELYNSFLNKLQYDKGISPKEKNRDDYTYVWGEPNEITTVITSDELTSFLNYNQPGWFDVKNIQIKIHNDGKIEFSGAVNIETILNNIEAVPDNWRSELGIDFIIPEYVNIYGMLKLEIKENKISYIDISRIEIYSINISSYSQMDKVQKIIKIELDNKLKKLFNSDGIYIKELTFANGSMQFQGNFPSSLKIVKNK